MKTFYSKVRCVLILSLILSSTLVTGHSINRRDSENVDDKCDDDDKMKMLKSISEMLKMSAQKIRVSVVMGYQMVRGGTEPKETNSTSDDSVSMESASMESVSMDDDAIVFSQDDDGPDVTSAMAMPGDDEDMDKEEPDDVTSIPTILNRSLLDTPIGCDNGQLLGKDGKCRVVW